MQIPDNYVELSRMIDDATNPMSPDIVQFRSLMEKADDIIEKAFRLTKPEQIYIKKRLSEFPLDRLEPRYPWTPGAHHQKTRVYTADRFA